jgi:hypothetical protein
LAKKGLDVVNSTFVLLLNIVQWLNICVPNAPSSPMLQRYLKQKIGVTLELLPTICFIAFRKTKTENVFRPHFPITEWAIALIGLFAALRRVTPWLWCVVDRKGIEPYRFRATPGFSRLRSFCPIPVFPGCQVVVVCIYSRDTSRIKSRLQTARWLFRKALPYTYCLSALAWQYLSDNPAWSYMLPKRRNSATHQLAEIESICIAF